MSNIALLEPDASNPWECEVEEPNPTFPDESPSRIPTRRRGFLPAGQVPWSPVALAESPSHLGDVRARLSPKKALHLLGILSLAEIELPRAERELEAANREVLEASERAAALSAEVAVLRDIRSRVNRTVDTSLKA